jgi:hypothetical protein
MLVEKGDRMITHSFKTIGLAIILLVAMLTSQGCPTQTKLGSLENLITSLEVLLPILEQADPARASIYAQVDQAIQGLPQALQATQTELATQDNDWVKAGKIAGYFGPSIQNIQALPPTAKVIAQGVLNAIQAWIKAITPTTPPPTTLKVGKGKSYPLPGKDVDRIFKLTERIGKLGK